MNGAPFEQFPTPPPVLILLCLVGILVALFRPRLGMPLALAASLCLYAAATPVVASALLSRLERRIPTGDDPMQAQAIVVLGASVQRGRGNQPDVLGPLSWQRVVYAAEAYRRLHLPVAVSGGRVHGSHASEAALMQAALQDDFAVPVAWSEDRSKTTFENARDTSDLLRPAHIDRVVLVTQAWHMPRALWSFARVGLHPVPWPVPRDDPRTGRIGDFLPSMAALYGSFHALHEWLGLAYYRLRY